MITLPPLILAEYHRPLFGNQWLALAAVLVGVAILMVAVAFVGRWLAATHPDPVTAPIAAAVPVDAGLIAPEVLAVIAASIAATLGARARIAGVRPATAPNVEMLMQQWSLEGRRQIYSSHQVR